MRYLKTYKIFESLSTEDVREDLTEICYELTDDRFGIKIYDDSDFPGWGHIPGTGMIVFFYNADALKNNHYHGFSFDEVRDVVLRVVDYLGDRYKECSVLYVGEN